MPGCMAWLIVQSSSTGSVLGQTASVDEAATQRAVVDRYCTTCHNSKATTAATASGVVLDRADLKPCSERTGALGASDPQTAHRCDAA
jgi:hypothetical protein